MNLTHLHLLITHLPIFGSILGAVVLFNGLWTKSNQTKVAAYYLFLISSIGTCIAYLTGEAAEESVENIQSVSEILIEQHEDSAIFAMISLIALGFFSMLAIYINLKKSRFSKSIAIFILVLSIISFSLVSRTGYLGGQIRHTEIVNPSQNIQNIDRNIEED